MLLTDKLVVLEIWLVFSAQCATESELNMQIATNYCNWKYNDFDEHLN